MKLEKRKLTLSTGEQVWYEYDQDGDMLEIIFRSTEATCAIELTESIILRFDWETSEPLVRQRQEEAWQQQQRNPSPFVRSLRQRLAAQRQILEQNGELPLVRVVE